MGNKMIVEFDLNGKPLYIEAEENTTGMKRISRTDVTIEKSKNKFSDVVSIIKPAAEIIFNSFNEMNNPEEICMEFGIKFNAKTGVVFASVDSEATFKISLKWSNTKEQRIAIRECNESA